MKNTLNKKNKFGKHEKRIFEKKKKEMNRLKKTCFEKKKNEHILLNKFEKQRFEKTLKTILK